MDENLLDLGLGLLNLCLKACFGCEGVLVVQDLEVVASKIRLSNFGQFAHDFKQNLSGSVLFKSVKTILKPRASFKLIEVLAVYGSWLFKELVNFVDELFIKDGVFRHIS